MLVVSWQRQVSVPYGPKRSASRTTYLGGPGLNVRGICGYIESLCSSSHSLANYARLYCPRIRIICRALHPLTSFQVLTY